MFIYYLDYRIYTIVGMTLFLYLSDIIMVQPTFLSGSQCSSDIISKHSALLTSKSADRPSVSPLGTAPGSTRRSQLIFILQQLIAKVIIALPLATIPSGATTSSNQQWRRVLPICFLKSSSLQASASWFWCTLQKLTLGS